MGRVRIRSPKLLYIFDIVPLVARVRVAKLPAMPVTSAEPALQTKPRYVLYSADGTRIGAIDVYDLDAAVRAKAHQNSLPNLIITPIEQEAKNWFMAWSNSDPLVMRDLLVRDNGDKKWYQLSGAYSAPSGLSCKVGFNDITESEEKPGP